MYFIKMYLKMFNGHVASFISQICVRKIKEGKKGRKEEVEEENFQLEGLGRVQNTCIFGMKPVNLVNMVL